MVVMRPDWGGGSTGYDRGQDAIAAVRPPKPPRSIARPAPKPAAPAPFMGGINRGYIPPVPNYAPPAPTQNWYSNPAPAQAIGGGGFGGGGFSRTASTAPAAPPEPPKPKPISEADWLSGDTEYQNEIKGYDDTLKDFLARITTQETDFKNDYDVAVKGFGRNRDRSMLSLGEDFTSRGLANSGMFADSRTKAKVQFEDQEKGMTTAKDRGFADFKNQRSDKQRATDTQKGNSRRASLARMAQKQSF